MANPRAEARTALLKQWVDAGMTLGNHTRTHPDFNRLTVEQFATLAALIDAKGL